MYFPSDMNFQYFFFDTYPGYFLQVFPVAILVGIIYWCVRLCKKEIPGAQKLFSLLFICYLAGLLCLVLLIDVIGDLWYRIIYHMDSGQMNRFFTWDFDFHPDFMTYFYDGERVINFLMFIPFGVLYPLSRRNVGWGKTILCGFLCSLFIEILQPVFGRAFDIDDVILNTAGAFVAASIYFLIKKMVRLKRN